MQLNRTRQATAVNGSGPAVPTAPVRVTSPAGVFLCPEKTFPAGVDKLPGPGYNLGERQATANRLTPYQWTPSMVNAAGNDTLTKGEPWMASTGGRSRYWRRF